MAFEANRILGGRLLALAPVLVLRGVLSTEEISDLRRKVHRAKPHWVSDYNGEQFSFPGNYYAAVATNSVDSYRRELGARRAVAEDALAIAERRVVDVLESLVACGGRFRPHEQRLTSGVVIFPANELVAYNGSPVHTDLEGIADEIENGVSIQALSAVLMVQKADDGGEIRVWRSSLPPMVDPSNAEAEWIANDDYVEVDYLNGDLVVFSSLRPHKILPFSGGSRITFNLFALKGMDGDWVHWF